MRYSINAVQLESNAVQPKAISFNDSDVGWVMCTRIFLVDALLE